MTFILFDRVSQRAAQLTHCEDPQRDCTRIWGTPVMETEQVVSERELTKEKWERKHRELELDMERRIRNSIRNHWLVIFMTIGCLGVAVHAVDERHLDMEPYVLLLAFMGVLANVATAFTASMRVESSVYYFLTCNVLEKDNIRERKTSRQWKWFFFKHFWVPIGLIVCMSTVACLTMVFLTRRAYKDFGQGVVSMLRPCLSYCELLNSFVRSKTGFEFGFPIAPFRGILSFD